MIENPHSSLDHDAKAERPHTIDVKALLAALLPIVLLLLWYGGKGYQARAITMIAIGIMTIWLAMRQPGRFPWLVFGVLLPSCILSAVVSVIQYGRAFPAKSIQEAIGLDTGIGHVLCSDVSAGLSSSLWTWALICLAGSISWICSRDQRLLRRVVQALVVIGTIHAFSSIILAVLCPGFPSADYSGRVRGCFVSPNQAVTFWGLLLPTAMLLWSRHGSPWGWCCSGLAMAIFCSASRGGIIAAALVCIPVGLVLVPARNRWKSAVLMLLMLAGIAYLINLTPVRERFSALADEHEISFSGRLSIWRSAWPLIHADGPWGTGAGTTMLAWRTTENSTFEPTPVGHLHCDPLEMLLEYGWLGCLMIGGCVVVCGLYLFKVTPRNRWHRTTVLGPLLGFGILGLHSCGDFLISNEALAAVSAVMLAAIVSTLTNDEADIVSEPLQAWIPKWPLIGSALILLSCVPWELRRATADRQFTDVARLTTSQTADPDAALAARERLVVEGGDRGNARLQALRARLILTQVDDEVSPGAVPAEALSSAAQCLADAARVSIGEPRAWLERARLALLQQPADGGSAALCLQHALDWAPAWMVGNDEIWQILSGLQVSAIPAADRQMIMKRVLASDLPQSPLAMFVAARELGIQTLQDLLMRPGQERTLAGARAWLRVQGSQECWLASIHAESSVRVISPAQELAAEHSLFNPSTWKVQLADSASGRQQQASQLQEAGLPIPSALQHALLSDGIPWSLWAHTMELLDDHVRQQLSQLSDADLAWASPWTARALSENTILLGDTSNLSANSDPLLLLDTLAAFDSHRIKESQPGERDRIRLLLGRYRRPEWIELPDMHWTWAYLDSKTPPIDLISTGWIGIVVDGSWIGWRRGDFDFRTVMGSGLHRLVIMDW